MKSTYLVFEEDIFALDNDTLPENLRHWGLQLKTQLVKF